MAYINSNLNSDKKLKHLDILNSYKFNLYQILNIVFRIKTNSIPQTLKKSKEINSKL